MSLNSLVSQLVDERSLEALESLTGSRNEEVLDALIEAAGQILADESSDPADDEIVEGIRDHLIDSKAVGSLIDALRINDTTTREFALGCLSEIGDIDAVPPMVALLKEQDAQVREAAAAHLALLTKYDFGQDIQKWTEWQNKRIQGLVEQAVEDREDEARMLKLKMRGNDKGKRDEAVH